MGRTQNLKPWPKGVSGNPGGRPKKKLIDRMLEELLETEDGEAARKVAQAILKKAKRGDCRAAQLIAERTEGKPIRKVQVTDGAEGPPNIRVSFVKSDPSAAELRERIAQLERDLGLTRSETSSQ